MQKAEASTKSHLADLPTSPIKWIVANIGPKQSSCRCPFLFCVTYRLRSTTGQRAVTRAWLHVEPLTISKISFLHWERQTIIVFSVREKIEGFKWRNVSPRSSFSKLSRLLTFLLNGICLFYDATNDSTHRHGYNDPRCADNFFSLAFSLVGARSRKFTTKV